MKVMCAWCRKLIGYKCPYCGEPLAVPINDDWKEEYMVCASGPTISYLAKAHMATSHGMCQECRAEIERGRRLTPEDKANLAALDGTGNRGER